MFVSLSICKPHEGGSITQELLYTHIPQEKENMRREYKFHAGRVLNPGP